MLRLSFMCDECGELIDTETGDFAEARKYLRDNDWRTKKDGEDWKHYCFGCSEDLTNEGKY